MTRDFLKGLNLSDEQINSIMSEYGKNLNAQKSEAEKNKAELDQAKAELENARATLEKFSDYDNVKAEIEKYKTDAEKNRLEYEKKIKGLELSARVKDFTSSKKFVNDLTKDAINTALEKALEDESNKGKSLDELLDGITKDKENIFLDESKPTPPKVPELKNQETPESGVLDAFKRLNPGLKID